MNTNRYQPPAHDADAKTSAVRVALAGFAVTSFLVLGILFLQSMSTRHWMMAIFTGVGALSIIPWASFRSAARDCWTGTFSLAVGSLGSILAVLIYLGLFNLEWFSEIFDHKGTGSIGMFFFAALGFGVSGYATLLILIRLSLPSSTSCSDLLTSCFNTKSSRNSG